MLGAWTVSLQSRAVICRWVTFVPIKSVFRILSVQANH
jgi:hypothetical protein